MAVDLPATAASGARRIVVDADHFAVRFMVPVMALVVAVLFHLLASSLLGNALKDEGITPGCAIIPGDLLAFFIGASMTERLLKRYAPARRYALLDDRSLSLIDQRSEGGASVSLEWGRMVNVQGWRFEVSRRTRVPKGWYCLALHLLQDEKDMILYTFMDGKDTEYLPGFEHFFRLRPRKETKNNPDLSVVAHQRRLLALEDRRWNDGAEISSDDFRAVLGALMSSVHEWVM